MLPRRYRIAAPFAVTGLIAAAAWIPTLQASASPDLPAISAAHLIDKALGADVTHLSGTFAWDANLGLPSLSGLTSGGQGVSSASGFDPTSLLSGNHSFEVWIDGAAKQRIAAPGTLEETDVVHNGRQAWVYDSSTNHVTRYVLQGRAPTGGSGRVPVDPASGGAMPSDGLGGTTTAPTPVAVADDLLGAVRSIGTRVSVSRPVEVAGRASYLLRLAPDRSIAANRASTVSYATIAVDAATGLPLRVSIYAVGQSGAPALQIGFTSIGYGTPAASEFGALHGQTTSTKVVHAPTATRVAPTATSSGNHVAVNHAVSASGWYGYGPLTQATPTGAGGRESEREILSGNATRVAAQDQGVGTRWAEGPVTLGTQVTAAVPDSGVASGSHGVDATGQTASWGSIADYSLGTISSKAATSEIDSATTVVSGAWGSGRLLTSTLVNALLLPDGKVLVGAVTPAALEAAAAHLAR